MSDIEKIAKLIDEGWTLDGWVDDGEGWEAWDEEESTDPGEEEKRTALRNTLMRRAQATGSDLQTPIGSGHGGYEWDQMLPRHRQMLISSAQDDPRTLQLLARKFANIDGKDWELMQRAEKSQYFNEVLAFFSEEY